MTESDIVDQVYRSCDFASPEGAESVIRTTLRNLGRCLSAGQARDVAAPLPRPLSEELVAASPEKPDPMPYEEFLERVRDGAELADRDVERDVRVVLSVLAGRIGEVEIENARAQLPPNYDHVFDVEPETVGQPFADLVAKRGTFDSDVDAPGADPHAPRDAGRAPLQGRGRGPLAVP
ncbi:DUF2267 domain-containing protein [Halobacteria archaeon AArc-curdl1]|uniref:DUF2267 domain-containing protein n=1 Tax=Natronosalvus hydrolyticus TaxID=2979988 RepID=A0AAP3E565_9EURY|nr:DUF2267 domain-containing protein [Halobacteria archaeon AArc-curdl1]